MPQDPTKRFRISGIDKNGDVHAFETNNRDRAKEMLEEFKKRFRDSSMETQRWI